MSFVPPVPYSFCKVGLGSHIEISCPNLQCTKCILVQALEDKSFKICPYCLKYLVILRNRIRNTVVVYLSENES